MEVNREEYTQDIANEIDTTQGTIESEEQEVENKEESAEERVDQYYKLLEAELNNALSLFNTKYLKATHRNVSMALEFNVTEIPADTVLLEGGKKSPFIAQANMQLIMKDGGLKSIVSHKIYKFRHVKEMRDYNTWLTSLYRAMLADIVGVAMNFVIMTANETEEIRKQQIYNTSKEMQERNLELELLKEKDYLRKEVLNIKEDCSSEIKSIQFSMNKQEIKETYALNVMKESRRRIANVASTLKVLTEEHIQEIIMEIADRWKPTSELEFIVKNKV
jgi:hypothetical protein